VKDSITSILEPGGILSQRMIGYEYRSQQLEMALNICDILKQNEVFFAEAGTGTGKSLAYLLPAAFFGKQIIISTGTKNLQEQLFFNDIPLLNKLIPEPVDAVLIKGRSNYLCRKRWDIFITYPGLPVGMSKSDVDRISDWIQSTETGDRSELPFLKDSSRIWSEICSRSQVCQGPVCKHYHQCFVVKLKIKAQKADLIIVNHHLIFADRMLKLKQRSSPLPEGAAVVFDEAHLIENIATEFLGTRVSNADIQDFISLLKLFKDTSSKMSSWALNHPIQKVNESASIYFGLFGKGEGRFDLASKYDDELFRQGIKLTQTIENLKAEMMLVDKIPDEVKIELENRLTEILESVRFIQSMNDNDCVFWGEHSQSGVVLHANPIDISDDFPELAGSHLRPVILTSATLTVGSSFDYICARLGMIDAKTCIYPSPFNYSEQAVLYLPDHLPIPGDDRFYDEVAEEVSKLIHLSEGRAFVLCTSYKGLSVIKEHLEDHIDYNLLVQGEAPKQILLDSFREDIHSVLIATISFWQGVDVPGPSLSCVIIDKLPFAAPSDPITKARILSLKEEGKDPFFEIQIPEAVMILKQGLGRLIRSQNDTGVVAIMDRRCFTRRYGEIFLSSIPEFNLTHDASDVKRFFDSCN